MFIDVLVLIKRLHDTLIGQISQLFFLQIIFLVNLMIFFLGGGEGGKIFCHIQLSSMIHGTMSLL